MLLYNKRMKVIFEDTLKKDLKNNNKIVDKYYNKSNEWTVQYPAYTPTKNIIDNQLNNHILVKPIKNKYDESFNVRPLPTYKSNLPILPNYPRDLKFWKLVC